MAAQEFPAIPAAAEKEKSFSIQQGALADMLAQVEYAQSTDETRFILNGVLFESSGKKFATVATDGRRLAMVATRVEHWPQFRTIVPAKALADVRRTLGCGSAVKVTMTERRTTFSFDTDESNGAFIGPVELHSKVVEGNYPDYARVVPKDKMESVKLVREEFQNCIKRASLVTSEKSNSVRLGFTSGKLSISASSPDFGEAHEEMQIEYAGPQVDVAFNPAFLLDPLGALPNDEVKFDFLNETSPGVIKAGESFACVVMPVRLS
jgi:DNA polymerase-3 subunit beta